MRDIPKDVTMSVRDPFDLTGRVAIITGGAGLLGAKHAEAVAEMGGIPVLLDLRADVVTARTEELAAAYGVQAMGLCADVTVPEAIEEALAKTLSAFGRVDILINNAMHDPKVEAGGQTGAHWSRVEGFPLDLWEQDLATGLTGAFVCSQIIGSELARRGKGVILNIASDLSIIAPDQRIYAREGVEADRQPVKPVTYSVVKAGLIGLTRYLATYWAQQNVRVNALSPGGVFDHQPEAFVTKLTNLIPMGRMATRGEYQGAVIFLCSDASAYMTGQNVVMDGGRSVW